MKIQMNVSLRRRGILGRILKKSQKYKPISIILVTPAKGTPYYDVVENNTDVEIGTVVLIDSKIVAYRPFETLN